MSMIGLVIDPVAGSGVAQNFIGGKLDDYAMIEMAVHRWVDQNGFGDTPLLTGAIKYHDTYHIR